MRSSTGWMRRMERMRKIQVKERKITLNRSQSSGPVAAGSPD
jgi:hypothetical protein